MKPKYKTFVLVMASLFGATYAQTSTAGHSLHHVDDKSENWYSEYFLGANYSLDTNEPVLAFSACASTEVVAEMLASATMSTSKKQMEISSTESNAQNSTLETTITSRVSGMELNYVVLRKDRVHSTPEQYCVLITQE